MKRERKTKEKTNSEQIEIFTEALLQLQPEDIDSLSISDIRAIAKDFKISLEEEETLSIYKLIKEKNNKGVIRSKNEIRMSDLRIQFKENGMSDKEAEQLINNTLNILKEGGIFTCTEINNLLEKKGYLPGTIDEQKLELLLEYLSFKFKYSVTSLTIN